MGGCQSNNCKQLLNNGPKACRNANRGVPMTQKLIDLKIGELGDGSGDKFCAINPLESLSCPCNGEFQEEIETMSCKYIAGEIPCACKGNGGVLGSKLLCRRLNYGADELDCCLSNFRSKGEGSIKTQGTLPNGDPEYTCDPKYTKPRSSPSDCFPYIQSFCLDPANQKEWNDGVCKEYVDVLYNTGGKALFRDALAKYFLPKEQGGFGGTLDEKGTENENFLSNLLSWKCSEDPSICDVILQQQCKKYTREDVLNSMKSRGNNSSEYPSYNLAKACACHLNANEYFKNEWIAVPPECDPLCIAPGAIPKTENGIPSRCSQTVCVLDGITIDAVNSSVGDISFKTLCGGCSGDSGAGSGCSQCYFSDVNFDIVDSKLNDMSFGQACGECFEYDARSPNYRKKISCGKVKVPTPSQKGDVVKSIFDNIYVTVSIVVLFVFLIAILFLAKK